MLLLLRQLSFSAIGRVRQFHCHDHGGAECGTPWVRDAFYADQAAWDDGAVTPGMRKACAASADPVEGVGRGLAAAAAECDAVNGLQDTSEA